MKLQSLSAPSTRLLELPNGVQVLFSYETAVAGFRPNRGYFRTDVQWSATTTRHINSYIGPNPSTTVHQEWIDNMFNDCINK